MADDLQTLAQILSKNTQVKKACVLGVVADSTNIYKSDENKDFIRKIKIIDFSLNPQNPIGKFSYCTVMFFAQSPEQLPSPSRIGQIIYLRRYDFNIWNENFQAKKCSNKISSWILFTGDTKQTNFGQAQVSKEQISLNSDKYTHLMSPLNDIRHFGRSYFQKNSIILNPESIKGNDLILKVQEAVGNEYTLTNGISNYTLTHNEKIKINSVVKIRSIDQIQNNVKLIKSIYTSVLEIEPWMKSYNQYSLLQQFPVIAKNYISLKQLKQLKPNHKARFNLKCEVMDINPKNFKQAIKHYNIHNNTFAQQNKNSHPVFHIRFLFRDQSLGLNQFIEAQLLSWDGLGSDFLPGIRLTEIQNSSLLRESQLYEDKINRLLEETDTNNGAEVQLESLVNGNKILYRVLNIQ